MFQLHTRTQKWFPGRVPKAEQFVKAVVDLELVLGFGSSPSYRGWSDRFCGFFCGVSSLADEAVRLVGSYSAEDLSVIYHSEHLKTRQ